jgi:hypothetical protein
MENSRFQSKIVNSALITAFVMLIASTCLSASRLLNYENRVVRAAEQVERIKTDREYREEGINAIKKLLPKSESVEFDGKAVLVDNTWLYQLIDQYVAEEEGSPKNAKLTEIAGRLRALDAHLRKADAAESNDPDGAHKKIEEILSRRAYQPEAEDPLSGFVKRTFRKVREFRDRILLSLQRLLERIFGAGAGSGWLSNVLLVVVLVMMVVAAVSLIRRIKRPQPKRKRMRVVLGEEIAADGTSRELAEAGFAAARAGDFRTAVRKLYVSLLYELNERNLIELDESATNREYLRRASGLRGLSSPMRYMTDRFDTVWYGMIPSSEADFSIYRARYEEAMQNARALQTETAGVS